MKNSHLTFYSIIFLTLFAPQLSFAELAIIVNPSSDISSITAKEAKRVFLGKLKTIKGEKLIAVDQSENMESRKLFYDTIIRKTESQLKSYWSTRIFSGKGVPPTTVGNDDDVKVWVSVNKDAIGYVDSTKIDNSVFVVYTVK